jgi:tetratricopeptide (TPR) repeat protein
MSSDSNDVPTICWSCKKRPATTRYTNQTGKLSELVCEPCLDLLRLQEAYGRGLLAWYGRKKDDNDAREDDDDDQDDDDEQYDEILAWLDTFEKENRHRDVDQWLAQEVAAHRAYVHWEAKRYAELLAACEQRDSFGYDYLWNRWFMTDLKAQALGGLGRHAEALAVFEEAFRQQDPRLVTCARSHLQTLVQCSTNVGKPVDESWRALAQRIAEHYHVEFPVRPTLAESMLALYEMTKTDAERMAPEDEDEDD